MSKDGVYTGDNLKAVMEKTLKFSELELKRVGAIIDECATKGKQWNIFLYARGSTKIYLKHDSIFLNKFLDAEAGKNSCEIAKNLYDCYEVALQKSLGDSGAINSSINQALLYTVENFADAHPSYDKTHV